jgi:uncharacterized protein YggE
MGRWVVGAVLLVAATAGCSRTTVMAPSAEERPQGLVVTGEGTVEVRPDVLVVTLGVSSTASTAPGALDAVSRRARGMLEAITGEGVPEHDIRTMSLEVRPERNEQGEVVGFVGTEMFRVRIKELATAGDVVSAAVGAAGDAIRIQGMSLDVSDPDGAAQQARRRAVEDALARGEELAESAGVELGPPMSIQESRQEEFRAFALPVADRYAFAAEAAALAPRIESGTRPVTVRVEVRFQIAEG